MKKLLLLLEMLILGSIVSACATFVVNSNNAELNKEATYLVCPFNNYTETPDAGKRVASMLKGILLSKDYKVLDSYQNESNGLSGVDTQECLQKARGKGIQYLITGSVNEFRYKTGIEGEPAVSITIIIYNTSDNKVIWSSTGSATGWSNQSRTTVAQKLLNKLMHL
ncbi:MAG: hypothetical protein QW076_05610 [Candidatus Anstonellales archaeon]